MPNITTPRLTKGTKEFLVVNVKDELGAITTLTGTGLTYDVMKRDGTAVSGQQALSGTNDGMKAKCLIDTTLAAYEEAQYQLFIKFSAFPEAPRLGPFEFQVSLDG